MVVGPSRLTGKLFPRKTFGLLLVLLSSACRAVAPPPSATPIPLATPVSQEPAAGICAGTTSAVVTVTIYPDIPDPRCAIVQPEQRLRLVNLTPHLLHVEMAGFEADIEPGGEYTFEEAFGAFLAPGVHQVQVLPCCGPELWLEPSGG